MKHLFSITKKDFRIDTFRAGGKGGQNQNKVESGVRITHIASGVSHESRESRDQLKNKKLAFEKVVNDKKFKDYIRITVAKMLGEESIVKQKVDDMMAIKNLRVDVKKDGIWVKENE